MDREEEEMEKKRQKESKIKKRKKTEKVWKDTEERGNEIEGKLSDKNSMYRSNGGINEFTKGKQYKEKGERDGK